MTIDSASLNTPAAGPAPAAVVFHRQRVLQLPRSPKVIAGMIIVGIFGVVSVIGRWITPYSPNATDVQHWVQH
ncbi:MAG: hypothetical protein ACREOM_00595, partial [Candidatus Dormibacteraceae bacterium]